MDKEVEQKAVELQFIFNTMNIVLAQLAKLECKSEINVNVVRKFGIGEHFVVVPKVYKKVI